MHQCKRQSVMLRVAQWLCFVVLRLSFVVSEEAILKHLQSSHPGVIQWLCCSANTPSGSIFLHSHVGPGTSSSPYHSDLAKLCFVLCSRITVTMTGFKILLFVVEESSYKSTFLLQATKKWTNFVEVILYLSIFYSSSRPAYMASLLTSTCTIQLALCTLS